MSESLIDSFKDIVFFKDMAGVYLECNPAFASFLDRSKEAIIGKTDYDLFEHGQADFFRQNDLQMLEQRQPRHNEEWVTYPDGSRHLLDTLKTPYFGDDGSVIGVLGVSRDITERYRMETALRESEENFHRFFDTIDDLIVVLTPEGRIVFTNVALQTKLAYTREELLTMHVLDLHAKTDLEKGEAIFGEMLRHERASCPLPLVTKGGILFPTETRIWLGKWNGQDCIFGISKDLTIEQEAKQRFELLFRNNPNPMALSTLPERKFIDVNDAFLRTLGYSKPEVIGTTSSDLGLFANVDDYERITSRLAAEHRISEIDVQVRTKAGAVRNGLFWGEVLQSQTSSFLLTVFLDITEQRKVSAALSRESERLQGIIRGTNVGTWEWNIQTGETIFNERWASMAGYTLEELAPLTIQSWIDLTHPEDLQLSTAALQRHFTGEVDSYEVEVRMRHKSGHWIWVLDRGQVIERDAHGEPLWMMGTHQEITARKQAEAEIARLSNLQRELMQLATEFVNVPTDRQDASINISLETMGRLIQADRAYLFAYDLKGSTMSNTHEWCNTGISAEIQNLQQIPLSVAPDWVAKHLLGELMHIPDVLELPPESTLRQVLEPQGIRSLITLPLMQSKTCLGFVGFDAVRERRVWKEDEVALLRVLAELYAHFESRRTTERTMLELQKHLTDARDKAQASAMAKTLFLANMSHEIRTPLNAILGYSQIIARECRQCGVAHRTKGLTKSSEHLLELINDVLELARTEGQKITLSPTHFNFHQLLEDVRSMFAKRPDTRALSLGVAIGPGVPSMLHADAGKIRQVLVNLVSNAVKFTEKGQVRVSAALLEQEGGDDYALAVDVEDTGCGIREEDQSIIFDLFARLEKDKRHVGGIGLGLPLCRRYALALGGNISVTSTEGSGSRFRFTFRAQPGVGEQCAETNDHLIRLSCTQPEYRILAVDDDTTNLDMLGTLLRSVGFVIETAEKAEAALTRLADTSKPDIDLLLLDRWMPGIDGAEALRRIRNLHDGKRLKVIVVTASGFADSRAESLAMGADGFVAKPIRLKQLLDEMARVATLRFDTEAPPPVEPVSFSPNIFCSIPLDLRRLLCQATRSGDIRQLRTLADQLATHYPIPAKTIRVCIDAYDYETLRKLLESAEERGS